MNLLMELRRGTAQLHKELDRAPIFRRLWKKEMAKSEFVDLLTAYYQLYGTLEQHWYDHPDLKRLWPDLEARRKARFLIADLRALGKERVSESRVPTDEPVSIPVKDSFYQGIGCLYVLEGSTLGGQVLYPRIKDALSLEDGQGCSFFMCYGDQVEARWQRFSQVLQDIPVTADQVQAAVEGARSTFRLFSRNLIH